MFKNSARLPAFLLFFLSSAAFGAATRVTVSGRTLQVAGQAFTVQGVDYSPVPVEHTLGATAGGCIGAYTWWSDRPAYVADFPLIKRMGANTIRAYGIMNDTSTATVLQVQAALDEAQAQGLYVIMNYFPSHFVNSADAAQQAAWLNGFVAAINVYKDHPAVLIWEFANEQNLDNGQFIGWYPFVQQVAAAAKAVDTDHPIMTVEGECPNCGSPIQFTIGSAARSADDASMTSLDIWGVNAYRGTSFQGLFETLASSTTKPLLVTEFGKDAYRDSVGGEDAAMQATYLSAQWQEIASNLSTTDASKNLIGGVVFEWSDEWWKAGSCNAHDSTVLFSRSGDTTDPNYQDEWFGLASVAAIDAVSNPAGTQRGLRRGYSTMQAFWNPTAASAANTNHFFSGTVRNYPNPFRLGGESTKFVVITNEAGTVDLRIYDAGGQFVTSFKRDVTAGRTEFLWDGRNRQGEMVSAGLYFVKIHGQGSHEETQFRRVVGVK